METLRSGNYLPFLIIFHIPDFITNVDHFDQTCAFQTRPVFGLATDHAAQL